MTGSPRAGIPLPLYDGPPAPESSGATAWPDGGDPELLRAGWSRRFVVAPPRLAEVVELYESLGYEVCAAPVTAGELRAGCDSCPAAQHLFRTLYTRMPR
jgi:hypothetical protein